MSTLVSISIDVTSLYTHMACVRHRAAVTVTVRMREHLLSLGLVGWHDVMSFLISVCWQQLLQQCYNCQPGCGASRSATGSRRAPPPGGRPGRPAVAGMHCTCMAIWHVLRSTWHMCTAKKLLFHSECLMCEYSE